MRKILFVTALVLCFALTSVAYAAEKETAGTKAKAVWKKVVNYPAKVTEESATVVTEAGKSSVGVVAKEVQRVGEVTTGDVAKTKELVVEPLTGTAETVVKATEGTVKVPVEAAKEAPAATKK